MSDTDCAVFSALSAGLIDTYQPEAIWKYESGIELRTGTIPIIRLVFKVDIRPGREDRALIYVDLYVSVGVIGVENHHRKHKEADYSDPASINLIYEFVQQTKEDKRNS